MSEGMSDLVIKTILGTGLALIIAGVIDPSLLVATMNLGEGLDVLIYPTIWFIMSVATIFWSSYMFVDIMSAIVRLWSDKLLKWWRHGEANNLEEKNGIVK